MTRHLTGLFILLSCLLISAPSMADSDRALSCDSSATVELDRLGAVNLAALQEETLRIEAKLKELEHDGRRGSRVTQRVELKRQLRDLTRASQDLHEKMFYEGCKEALRGASLETQLRILEEHLQMM